MATQQDVFNSYFGRTQATKGVTTEIVNTPVPPETIPNVISQRAEGNIGVSSFAKEVGKMLDAAWEDDWGQFTINGCKDGNIESFPLPAIVFDTVERSPSKGKVGLKSRVMDVVIDPDNDDYSLILLRKWFDCVVEFLVLDTTNQNATDLAERFELFIEAFTGFFKEVGVSELVFLKEVDSRLSKNYIASVPSRCLRYQLVIERIAVERVRTTKEVRSRIQSTSLNRG